MCLATSHNLLLILEDTPKQKYLFHEIAIFWSAKKRRKDTFFSHPSFPFPSNFCNSTVVAFVMLRNSRFNFHCYTQREATPTQKSARKWHCNLSWLLVWKITKGIHSCKPASLNRLIAPIIHLFTMSFHTLTITISDQCHLTWHHHVKIHRTVT